MCTAITLQSLEMNHLFARNLDFSYAIDPQIFTVSRNAVWTNSLTHHQMQDRYAFIGIGQETNHMLGLFDGVNERGFAAAALYFYGYAAYGEKPTSSKQTAVASFEFLHEILGSCASVKELQSHLRQIQIVGMEDPVTHSVAPLHWIVTDRSNACLVIEQTAQGVQFYSNPIGVLANSPDFRWQMTNLRNYLGASPRPSADTCWGNVPLTAFGQGSGTMLLPGGYTSPERFVRAAYARSYLVTPANLQEAVAGCFHVLDGVKVLKGLVKTNRDTYDYTQYTAAIDLEQCAYYWKTASEIQVKTARLNHRNNRTGSWVSLGRLTDAFPLQGEPRAGSRTVR